MRGFMMRENDWSLPKYFPSKAKWILRRYYFCLAAGNKKFQRANATAVRAWCKWIQPKIGWRRNKPSIHKHAHGSIVYHVFARKQWILCSALRHKSCFTLYLMLNRFEIHSALKVLSGTSLLGFRREAASSLAKTVKLKAFICKEGERKTKDFAVFYYIRHQIAAYASISKHFSYLAMFWYFN